MDRRRFLAGVAAGGLGGLAGCAGGPGQGDADDGRETTGSATTSAASGGGTATDPGIAVHGYPSTICEQAVIEDFAISAVGEPAVAADWSDHDVDERYRPGPDGELREEAVVVGVEAGGAARAYPLSVVWWHEIVNDRLGADDRPLLVTYCSICRSGLVAERLVGGEPATFGVSGQLWRPPELYVRASEASNRSFAADLGNASAALEIRTSGNLVMYDDATRSFWSQVLGQAICGPLTGTELAVAPSTLTTWASWRAAHPETDVLLPPPHSTLR